MITAFSHFKLGMLALITLVALAAAALVLGLRKPPAEVYHTYFDESVQGLETGAQVKFRGVKIGQVVAVDLAPDRRHVHVELAIERKHARALSLSTDPTIRAIIASMGVTGVKLVDLDAVDPKTNPPPALPFPVATPYLPSQRSFLVELQEGVSRMGERLPALADRMTRSFDGIDRTIESVDRVVRSVDREKLPAATASTLRQFATSASKLDKLIDQIRSEGGVLTSARRASDSLANLGRETREVTTDVSDTLHEIRESARGIRDFFDTLERQPDMLVKGRRQGDP